MGEREKFSGIILGVSLRLLMNMMLVFFLVEGFVNSYHFSYKLFSDIPYMAGSSSEIGVTIAPGSSAYDVAELLDGLGIVDGKYLFLARVYLGKYQTKIIAGTYSLGPGMSPDTICRRVCGMKTEDES